MDLAYFPRSLGIFRCSGLEHIHARAYTTPPLRILGVALRAYLSRFTLMTASLLVKLLRWALKPDEAANILYEARADLIFGE